MEEYKYILTISTTGEKPDCGQLLDFASELQDYLSCDGIEIEEVHS